MSHEGLSLHGDPYTGEDQVAALEGFEQEVTIFSEVLKEGNNCLPPKLLKYSSSPVQNPLGLLLLIKAYMIRKNTRQLSFPIGWRNEYDNHNMERVYR